MSQYRAFIQDDNGDVTQGPAESYKQANQRALDSETSSDRIVKTWVQEIK